MQYQSTQQSAVPVRVPSSRRNTKRILVGIAIAIGVWLACGLTVFLLGATRAYSGSFTAAFVEIAPTRATRTMDSTINISPPLRVASFDYQLTEEAGGLTLIAGGDVLIRGCRIHGVFVHDSHEVMAQEQHCMVTLADGSRADLAVSGTFGLPKNPFVRSLRGHLTGSARAINGVAAPLPFPSETYELRWPNE